MSIACKVQISLEIDHKRLDAIQKSLEPDNVDIPPGMEITTHTSGDIGTVSISGEISQVIGTVDEILSHAQVMLEVVQQ